MNKKTLLSVLFVGMMFTACSLPFSGEEGLDWGDRVTLEDIQGCYFRERSNVVNGFLAVLTPL